MPEGKRVERQHKMLPLLFKKQCETFKNLAGQGFSPSNLYRYLILLNIYIYVYSGS